MSGNSRNDVANSYSVNPLSPRRNSSEATSEPQAISEQIRHAGIDENSELGKILASTIRDIYHCHDNVDQMWSLAQRGMQKLDKDDSIALFNAKKLLSFQLAKVLDNLQQPFRKTYQNLGYTNQTLSAKGPYPVFDNVTALFSATPVIARTATYIFACAEWIADAFEGKDLLLEIYSRLLNPTSISLANHIVDLEAGPYAADYMAWNFNSGMAAIDATLSNQLSYGDILITSQNIYGGAHQLINDWFAKPSNFNVAVERFKGDEVTDFESCLALVKDKYSDRLLEGSKIHLYLESPCNPHGYVLDVPGICVVAHSEGISVMLDASVGTPFLQQPLQLINENARPDFLIHSLTKDICGSGSVIAGCVIGRNADMFNAKGAPGWDKTMFWNVYYVKGAFLSADAAFEVMQGMRTMEIRMLKKSTNTVILSEFFSKHPDIQVSCSSLNNGVNKRKSEAQLFLGLPAPLFTVNLPTLPVTTFQRFFDNLEPTFSHMISLGQTNSIISCPGLTTHSELEPNDREDVSIFPYTIRFAIGIEAPTDLIEHIVSAARISIDPDVPGFSEKFLARHERNKLIKEIYLDVNTRYIDASLAG
ncbi:MAG: PLP-dependent transferase [Halioglobus sp.]